ncbi:MAG TPA: DNA polymerase I [Acidimicrobiales bacterium]|nr:DNA polymerase I [Acidimicrobiales bacterium]
MASTGPVLLIDGNSLTYRAFFALPTDLATASGQVTNAVYGFTSMLVNLLRDHGSQRIAVAFDRPEPTFRHEMVDTYKANRDAAPDILRQQMGLVREVLESLGIPILDKAGFEADDILATLATQARDQGVDTLVVTGDRDTYQLVEDPHVKVLYNRRGVSDYVMYDEAGIEERTGVKPTAYVQYAALRGDPSDNLPGVPGVGEKTAAKLVNTYGDLDGIFAHLDEQSPKLRQNLADNEAHVRQNLEMMKLVLDVPLDLTVDQLVRGPIDKEELRRLFDFLEFHSLGDRLTEALGDEIVGLTAGVEIAVLEAEVTVLESAEQAVKVLGDLRRAPTGENGEPVPLALTAAWEGDEGRSPLEGIALVRDAASGDVVWLPAALVDDEIVRLALAQLLGTGDAAAEPLPTVTGDGTIVDEAAKPAPATGRPIALHQAKALMRWLLDRGVDMPGLALDTAIAAYLIDPAEARYLLDELVLRYAHAKLPEAGSAAASGQLDLEATSVSPAQLAGREALAVDRLAGPLIASLEAQHLRDLNDQIEVPLIRVLARMEHIGVGVDAVELKALRDRLVGECDRLRDEIYADAGREFNVNSTLQLREILFDQLGLSPQKKTKTGYSTDASSLEKLAGQHPIIEHLLSYREVEKLRSTYGDGLLAEVAADGRIHATFNQTVARTGRLSSDAPNLHNIPVRSELGREFRKAFVPAEGYELLVADYNQIELRCIAHLAEDPGLIDSFASGRDIHTETASRIFSVEPGDVTIEQRSKAKMVSYGLAYGMEAYGLGQRLNIPTEDAAVILNAYFEAFPSVKAYMERTVREARERGYTETLFGRRRPIPELSSSNFRIRQAGERQAMNAGIQGLAADIFKVALVRLDHELEAQGLGSRVILQVHDEVLLEAVPSEHDTATAVVLDAMSGAVDLQVPLEVNLAFGPSWAEAKG